MTNNLTDEEQERGEKVYENLRETKEGLEEILPKMREALDGEITADEYEEWVDSNEELLSQVDS